MRPIALIGCCLALICAASLSGCGITPQPSHGAADASGITVYGTVDVGVGKSRSNSRATP